MKSIFNYKLLGIAVVIVTIIIGYFALKPNDAFNDIIKYRQQIDSVVYKRKDTRLVLSNQSAISALVEIITSTKKTKADRAKISNRFYDLKFYFEGVTYTVDVRVLFTKYNGIVINTYNEYSNGFSTVNKGSYKGEEIDTFVKKFINE